MAEVICQGLPASWLNAWMAAVGATVLDPRIKVRWTTGRTPKAVLCSETIDPVEALAASWPDPSVLSDMPIAKHRNDTPPLPRKVPVDAFKARARATRRHPYSWTLSSTMTDLSVDENGEVAHAPFDPSVPKGLVIHERLLTVHRGVQPSAERLMDSLTGGAERIKANGLGFDLTRMGSQSDASDMTVDPVVEVLAFFGLALLPVRGTGTDRSIRRFIRASALQRGWVIPRNRREPPRFRWPAWTAPMDRHAIDALLDSWKPDKKDTWSQIGVHAGWQSVQFKPKATKDVTRAFGAEQL